MSDSSREARRRRILENSEQRYQRILGLAGGSTASAPIEEYPTIINPPVFSELLSGPKQNEGIQESSQMRQRFPNEEFKEDDPSQQTFIKAPFLAESETVLAVDKESNNSTTIITIVALSAITILFSGYGSFIADNALFPFIIYQIVSIFLTKEEEKTPGTIINIIIMFSKLPEGTVKRVTKILQRAQHVLQDLCLYVFVCIIFFQLLNTFV